MHKNKITDELLAFHNIIRKSSGRGLFSCVSCMLTVQRCKCCIRPSATWKLTFEAKTRCAGCNKHIEKGKKPCSGQKQSFTCRLLENTLSKRKFDEISSINDDELAEVTPNTQVSSRESNVLIDKVISKYLNSVSVNTDHAASGLQIVSDWTDSDTDISTNTGVQPPDVDLLTSQPSTMYSELLNQISEQTKENNRLSFKLTQANEKIMFSEKQLKDASDKLGYFIRMLLSSYQKTKQNRLPRE